jgi:hypothetical protein
MLKIRFYILVFGLLMVAVFYIVRLSSGVHPVSNGNAVEVNSNPAKDSIHPKDSLQPIDEKEAIALATKNAATAYSDLSIYDIQAKLDSGIWHVDFMLKNKEMNGGGPHYKISEKTGKIISAVFEQ